MIFTERYEYSEAKMFKFWLSFVAAHQPQSFKICQHFWFAVLAEHDTKSNKILQLLLVYNDIFWTIKYGRWPSVHRIHLFIDLYMNWYVY